MSAATTYVEGEAHYASFHGTDCALLVKPNISRAAELCTHTILLFGQGKLVSEMIFKLAHRRFKGCLETNMNDGQHITGVEDKSLRLPLKSFLSV